MKIMASIAALALLTSAAMADENYRPRDGEKYTPQQYCHWQNRMLPVSNQKICHSLDLPIPTFWFPVPGTEASVDLNSVRGLASNRFGIGAIASVRNGAGIRKIAFTCTDARFSDWQDAEVEWMAFKPGSPMEGVWSVVCSGNLSDIIE